MDFARALRTIRAAKGLSQKQLAEQLGRDASYLSLIEAGRRIPSTAMIQELAGALHVPVYLLMFLASEETDLRGISEGEAQALSRQLLDILIGASKA